jgi:hypothetical protein
MMTRTDEIPAENLADLESVAVAVAAGKKPDPELVRRVRERARQATAAIHEQFGDLDIAVRLIREARDER